MCKQQQRIEFTFRNLSDDTIKNGQSRDIGKIWAQDKERTQTKQMSNANP
jgi:hypothetical protein